MSTQNSHSQNDKRITTNIELLKAVDVGIFDSLKCPKCGLKTVSAWFTNPAKDEYLTWLLCDRCDFEVRAIHLGRPKSFTPERIRPDLQRWDEKIVKEMKFPRPKT